MEHVGGLGTACDLEKTVLGSHYEHTLNHRSEPTLERCVLRGFDKSKLCGCTIKHGERE